MNASLLDRITIEPGKCGGKPCIRSMRIRVSDILELMGEGVNIASHAAGVGVHAGEGAVVRGRHDDGCLLYTSPSPRD